MDAGGKKEEKSNFSARGRDEREKRPSAPVDHSLTQLAETDRATERRTEPSRGAKREEECRDKAPKKRRGGGGGGGAPPPSFGKTLGEEKMRREEEAYGMLWRKQQG